jgi:hypothetical protein
MDILTMDSLIGIGFFLLGVVFLNKCASLDHKNVYKMRKLKKVELYGRREVDSIASLPLNIKGTVMTCLGSGLALYGFILFFDSVL